MLGLTQRSQGFVVESYRDRSRQITDYVIQRSAGSKPWTTVGDGVSTTRRSLIGGLTNGTSYRFRVAAKNAVGVGAWSAAVRATPRAG